MGNAIRKDQVEQDTIQLDAQDALSAALKRAEMVPASSNVLALVSPDDWRSMDCRDDNILVFDPD